MFGVEVIVPIFICVVLPVAIVWLVMRARQNETNRKAEIMLKAIESGTTIDPEFFKPKTAQKTIKEKLMGRLTGACVTTLLGIVFLMGGMVLDWRIDFFPISLSLLGGILLAVGVALFLVYFVSKRMLAKEIEAEEKALDAGE